MLGKYLTILDGDILCECKDINSDFDQRDVLHTHDGYEMLLMLNGKLNMYTEGDGKTLDRGDLICVNTHCFHQGKLISSDVYDRVVINFKESVLTKLSTDQSDLGKCFKQTIPGKLNFFHLDEDQVHTFLKIARKLQQALADKSFCADVLSYSLLAQLLVMTNRCVSEDFRTSYKGIIPQLVSETFAYIDEHLTEELTLNVLEKQLQYNKIYISRCFKKVMGITLQQYIIIKRCSLAQQYLKQGHSPCDSCFMAGFNNYSSFSRTFSRQIGVSPKKYQLQQGK